MAKHNETGKLGEEIAAAFLKGKGYAVVECNYRRKWGEVDIIAKKNGVTHFVEVKTISRENISHGSRERSDFRRPEDNMHEKKIKRLHRAIQSYLEGVTDINDWQLDLVTVVLYVKDKKAKCCLIENVL